ncbi:MAG: hypothetical protein QXD34_01830 [Candidatus Bathyarchaeia archaeon]
MVYFELIKGRKSGNDKLVKVYSYGEVFTVEDLLRLLQAFFESEDSNYPISRGKEGRAMLLKAIIDVYSGIPLEKIIEKYKLNRKKVKKHEL